MKLMVTTSKFAYQGLPQGTVIDGRSYRHNGLGNVEFRLNGKNWILHHTNVAEFDNTPEVKPIKSDGGSSSYYDLSIPDWLFELIAERKAAGNCFIKTEEMITAFLDNDFDAGNIQKSLIRAHALKNGGGKEGNTIEYECNKMVYSANKMKEAANRA